MTSTRDACLAARPPRLFTPLGQLESSPRSSVEEFREELVSAITKLHRFAAGYCRTASDADDAVQNTCERVLARWQQWSGSGRLEQWLISILINRTRDEERARGSRTVCPLDKAAEPGECSNAAECVYLEQVQREALQLPGHLREVLWLVTCEGLSYRDTARTLRVPVGTVMSRLNRARDTLRRRLAA